MASRFLRSLKTRTGISAPRLLVRTHIPWPLRFFMMGALLALGVWGGKWVFERGMELAGFEKYRAEQRLTTLESRKDQLEQENAALRAANQRTAQQIEIEQVAQKDLAKSIKALQDENATLREDNAFFRNLLSPDKGADPVSIYHFKLERNPVLAGEHRYRLLLLKSGKREQEFVGQVQLLITAVGRNGEKLTFTVPEVKAGAAKTIGVSFKYYQRLEGMFQLPDGVSVKTVQVRVFESGAAQPRWTKTFTL